MISFNKTKGLWKDGSFDPQFGTTKVIGSWFFRGKCNTFQNLWIPPPSGIEGIEGGSNETPQFFPACRWDHSLLLAHRNEDFRVVDRKLGNIHSWKSPHPKGWCYTQDRLHAKPHGSKYLLRRYKLPPKCTLSAFRAADPWIH